MEKNPIPLATSPLAAWLSYLENLHSKTIDMGLERSRPVAARLDVLKPAPFVITVAGTNGKGTTCRTLEAVLMAAGYKVGVYSSPHLVRYTERVRVQNQELAEAAHTASFAEIEAARGDISLTYFEYGTLSALWLFKQAQLDVVILEVGLGGRLDATNMVDADVAVVTSIALDHTDWLGPDRESIGREKAGIFRAGKPAVVGEPDMPHTIADVAQEKGATLLRRDVDWQYAVSDNDWRFSDAQGALENLPLPQVPQPNAATALAALRASGLDVSEQAIRDGIQNALLPAWGPVGSGLLSIQGTSFNFVAPLIMGGTALKTGGADVPTMMAALFGTLMLASCTEMVISRILHLARRIITPLVSGVVVMIIGLSLIQVGLTSIGGGYAAMNDHTFGAPKNLLLAGIVLAIIILLNRQRNPYLRVASRYSTIPRACAQ
jgi:hypothetical protein